jgi:nicotinamide-nucleotide amidase
MIQADNRILLCSQRNHATRAGRERNVPAPGAFLPPPPRPFAMQQMLDTDFPRIDKALVTRAAEVIALARQCRCSIVTAESCTAGLLAAVLAEPPGAGQHLHGGFVTYTKDQKTIALGVPAEMLRRETAVSANVARAMAEGALARSGAELSVSVTGVAGPEPDEDGNPVGLVHIAAARRNGAVLHSEHRFGDIGRAAFLHRTILAALALLQQAAGDRKPPRTALR